MAKNIVIILTTLILAILQITLMPFFNIGGVWPNLILLTAVILIILDFETESLLTAAVGGIFLDLASPLPFGIYSLLLILLVLLAKLMFSKFLTDLNIVIAALFLGLMAMLFDSVIMLIVHNFSWKMLLVSGVYSALAGFLIYRFFERWFKNQPIIKMFAP